MKFKNYDVRVSKELLPSKIKCEKEIYQNLYIRVIKRFNQIQEYDKISMSPIEFYELLGIDMNDGYDAEKVESYIQELTKSNQFEYKYPNIHMKVGGSVFNIARDEEKGIYTIAFNYPFNEWLITKTDLKFMDKSWKRKKVTDDQRKSWELAEQKRKTMLLLNEAEFLGIRGKYSKIIYVMVKEFGGSREKYRELSWEDFKKQLEIPEKLRMCDIDKGVLNPAKEELESYISGLDFEKIKNNPAAKNSKVRGIKITWKKINDGKEKIKEAEVFQEKAQEESESVSVTEEEENLALEILTGQGITKKYLSELKKKNFRIYQGTLRQALKN